MTNDDQAVFFRCPKDLKEILDEESFRTERSISSVIRRVLRQVLTPGVEEAQAGYYRRPAERPQRRRGSGD